MTRTYLTLALAALSLAWLVCFGAGPARFDLDAALLLIGVAGLFHWASGTGQRPPRLPRWQKIALWAVPAYAAFQLVPLPQAVLQFLSPARALLTDSLSGVMPNLLRSPISVRPPIALFAFFALVGFLIMFTLVKDVAWRCIEPRPWLPAAPLAAIACLEAFIAIRQWISGPPNASLVGTFLSSEDLAALLDIALPFTLVYGFLSFRRYQTRAADSRSALLWTGLSWGVSLLLLIVLMYGASGASGVALGASLFVLVCLIVVPSLRTKKLRWCGAGLAGAIGFLGLLFLAPPLDFAESLAGYSPAQAGSTLSTWTNATMLIGDYRWFGAGPGGFESTYLRYQGSSNLDVIATPGNDVLSLLIAYGLIGFVILIVAAVAIIRPAVQGALYLPDEPRRLLAAAVTASFIAVLFRGCLESSLSVPAIAMASSWLAGLSQASGPD